MKKRETMFRGGAINMKSKEIKIFKISIETIDKTTRAEKTESVIIGKADIASVVAAGTGNSP